MYQTSSQNLVWAALAVYCVYHIIHYDHTLFNMCIIRCSAECCWCYTCPCICVVHSNIDRCCHSSSVCASDMSCCANLDSLNSNAIHLFMYHRYRSIVKQLTNYLVPHCRYRVLVVGSIAELSRAKSNANWLSYVSFVWWRMNWLVWLDMASNYLLGM